MSKAGSIDAEMLSTAATRTRPRFRPRNAASWSTMASCWALALRNPGQQNIAGRCQPELPAMTLEEIDAELRLEQQAIAG